MNNNDFYLNSYSDDESKDSPNIVSLPTFSRKLTIVDIIGDIILVLRRNYCLIIPTKKQYKCLSHYIDNFELKINNKMNISTIVNKDKEKDCEFNSDQSILILNCIQFLRIPTCLCRKKNQEMQIIHIIVHVVLKQ